MHPLEGVLRGWVFLVPAMMSQDDLESVNPALAWTAQLPTVFVPTLSGVIVAAWGAPIALALDALSFLVMVWALMRMPDIPRLARASTQTASKRVAGPDILRDYPVVIALTSMSPAFFFAYGPLEASLAVHARERLHLNADGFGLLWAVLGVGAVLGNLSVPWLRQRRRPGQVLAIIAIQWGAAEFSLGLSNSLPVALASMLFCAAVWGPYMPLETSLSQRVVPPDRHGLVMLPANVIIMLPGLVCMVVGLMNANRLTLRDVMPILAGISGIG